MKIAVCLSGQPRSIEFASDSIIDYFSTDSYSVDYFCHSWNYNTWKTKSNSKVIFDAYEPVETAWLKTQLQRFNPVSVKIDNYAKMFPHMERVPWASLFYSMMYSNFLKIKHERHADRYDYVIKARYDIVFEPGKKFQPPPVIKSRHIYVGHAGRMPSGFDRVNASDTLFYGDSWGMDIIADSYYGLVNYHDNEYMQRYDQVGPTDPGHYIHQQAHKYNVNIEEDGRNLCEIIYRKEMAGINTRTDFDKIKENHISYYDR